MFQKIKNFIVVGVAGLAMFAPGLLVPALGGIANAETIQQSLCKGSNEAAEGTSGQSCDKASATGDPSTGLAGLAKKVVNFITILVGAIAVVMVIFGGFRYITSGGDSGRVGNAKNTIIYAIIGLIIVALAQVLVHFVINTASTTGPGFAN